MSDSDFPDVLIIDHRSAAVRKTYPAFDPSRLPNPWLDDPHPKSAKLPTIRSTLRNFEESFPNDKIKDEKTRWPFRLDPHNGSRIHYYDHRGYGNPPDDIGYVGDVYLDMGSFPKRVWICEASAIEWHETNWVLWGPKSAKISRLQLAEHPLLKERWLWFRPSGGMCWYGRKHLVHVEVPPHESHDPTPRIDAMLQSEGRAAGVQDSASPSTRLSKNLKRVERSPSSDNTSIVVLDRPQSRNRDQQSASKQLISRLGRELEKEEYEKRSLKRKYDEVKEQNDDLKKENAQLKRQLQEAQATKHAALKEKEQLISRSERLIDAARNFVKIVEETDNRD